MESSIVPIRAELNRTKEQCNKERQGRLQAQQQVAAMRDQISMLEQVCDTALYSANTTTILYYYCSHYSYCVLLLLLLLNNPYSNYNTYIPIYYSGE